MNEHSYSTIWKMKHKRDKNRDSWGFGGGGYGRRQNDDDDDKDDSGFNSFKWVIGESNNIIDSIKNVGEIELECKINRLFKFSIIRVIACDSL